MSNNNPLVSVIIVTYNRINVLKNCLEAIKNQTFSKDLYEVIVVDDGSTDGTKEYLQSLDWGDNPQLKIFFNDHMGCTKSRNFAVQKAQGKIISFTDDDCVPEDKWLEKVVDTFSTDHSLGIVGAVTKVAFSNRLFSPLNQSAKKRAQHSDHKRIQILQGNEIGFVGLRPFSACNLHVKKSLFEQLGGFDESMWPAEDLDFMYRFLQRGGKAANRLDLWVDHYERDDWHSMLRRWVIYGKSDTEIIKRYLSSRFSMEVNLFHGIVDYHFYSKRFPLTIYLNFDLSKIILALVFTLFILPFLGFPLLTFFVGGLIVKQKDPKLTFSFLVYSFLSQICYSIGALTQIFKKGVICI